MLLGLAMIAVPLVLGIISAALELRALAATGQKIVIDGVTAARASQDLVSQMASLERTARLYDVINTPTLLDLYRNQDSRLTAIRAQLYLHAGPDVRKTLEELGRQQDRTRRLVLTMQVGPGMQHLSLLSTRFAQLSALVDRIAQESNTQIDRELDGLNEQTVNARRRLYLEAVVIILPLIGAAIVLVTVFVGRPLRKLDRAISELGEENLKNTISVNGPPDIERLGRKLEWLRGRLLEFTEERNRFLREMSHELKTPLASIVQGAELLMDGTVGELDANQREVMAILRNDATNLQRMIDNLLSFAAWKSSKLGLELSEFHLLKVVSQVIENQQLAIYAQRVRLDARVEDVPLVADRRKIRLILENLLSNAIKYSPKRGVIHLRARKVDSQVVLDVADNGKGIPAEEREHIFEAFYTGRASRSSKIKGTGIGLSVVQEFVQAHGGQIEIIDGEFPGAHFRITLPVNTAKGDSTAGSEQKARAHAA